MPLIYLYNPFESDFIEELINAWMEAEQERGWKKDLVRVRYDKLKTGKPLKDLAEGDTLYIIGHGDVAANRICDRMPHQGGTPEVLMPDQLATRLKTDGLADKKIKIKIYSCLAARGVLDSFAKNAALQIKMKSGSMGGLSCKFTIYGYNEIVSVLLKHPTLGYGKFVGHLKKDMKTIELTDQKASKSKEILVKPGMGVI